MSHLITYYFSAHLFVYNLWHFDLFGKGYLTEDSSGGSIGSTKASLVGLSSAHAHSLVPQNSSRLHTPGPLSSARARRPRRSRSACSNLAPIPGSPIKHKSTHLTVNAGGAHGTENRARSKMRTPMAARPKALSADRTSKFDMSVSPHSPPTFLRFPKPGELVLSKCGSPLVAQM